MERKKRKRRIRRMTRESHRRRGCDAEEEKKDGQGWGFECCRMWYRIVVIFRFYKG